MTDHKDVWDLLLSRRSEMQDIPLGSLRVDHRFQRNINPHSLARIKAEYHPNGIGHILLAAVEPLDPSEPRLAIIDGQTRYRALMELNAELAQGKLVPAGVVDTIRAEVFPEITAGEAALLFRLRNAQRPVPPAARYRVGVTEGDPEITEVVKQAWDAGYVLFSDDPNTPETFPAPAIDTAKRLMAWGKRYKRPGLLQEALQVQAIAFGTPANGLQGSIDRDGKVLQATADLLLRHPKLSEAELSTVMATRGLMLILEDAQRLAEKDQLRTAKAVQIILRDMYNRGKSRADRLDPNSVRVKVEIAEAA